MEIKVDFFGPIGEQAGKKRVVFCFSDQASYGDLLDEIGERFGDRFHERIWDSEEKIFKPGILVVGQGRDLGNRDTPLLEGEEVKIIPVLSGG